MNNDPRSGWVRPRVRTDRDGALRIAWRYLGLGRRCAVRRASSLAVCCIGLWTLAVGFAPILAVAFGMLGFEYPFRTLLPALMFSRLRVRAWTEGAWSELEQSGIVQTEITRIDWVWVLTGVCVLVLQRPARHAVASVIYFVAWPLLSSRITVAVSPDAIRIRRGLSRIRIDRGSGLGDRIAWQVETAERPVVGLTSLTRRRWLYGADAANASAVIICQGLYARRVLVVRSVTKAERFVIACACATEQSATLTKI